MGRTPREVLHDPDLPFNAACMRAFDRVRGIKYDVSMSAAADGDDMGIKRIITLLSLSYRE